MKKIVHFTCYDVKQFGLESKFAVILAIGRSVEGVIGQFQKISILYHGRLLGFPKGRGGSRLWNSEGMGGYLRLEIRRHGGIPQVGFLE